ncbi:hypothetical protein SK128_000822 [Halocaridina rubra]|uniref:Uncharacterized protein n=1 Tax=Halocaridina rubra TaxID=373956 RepID=A0AAN9AF95_HALRR
MHRVLYVILIFLWINYGNKEPIAYAEETGTNRRDSVTFPGKFTWGYVKDISEPLIYTTSGDSKSTSNSRIKRNDLGFKGSVTYGARGRWVGRAIPVITQPRNQVVSASMFVNGGDPHYGVYNPYEHRQYGINPSSSPPYAGPPQGSNYHPPYAPNWHNYYTLSPPPPPSSNYPPCRYCQGNYHSLTRPRVVYREVDPSYLVYANNQGPRSLLLSREPVRISITPYDDTSKKFSSPNSNKFGTSGKRSINKFFDESKIELLDMPKKTSMTKKPRKYLHTKGLLKNSTRVKDALFSASTNAEPKNNVVSGIIRILPAIPGNEINVEGRSKPIFFSIRNHQDNTRRKDVTDEDGWTVIRQRFIGTIRQIFPPFEERTRPIDDDVEILPDFSDRLALFGTPILPSRTTYSLDSDYEKASKDRVYGITIAKFKREREGNKNYPAQPMASFLDTRDDVERDSSMKISTHFMTLSVAVLVCIGMSHWLLK